MRAVLLDVLGTVLELVDPLPTLAASLRERFRISVGRDELQLALEEEIRYYRRHHLEGGTDRALEALRLACAEVFLGALPACAKERLNAAQAKDALLSALRFRPYPEAARFLAALRSLGLRVGAVSNWDCSLRAVLERAGLGTCFDAVVSSAEVGAAKPAPAPFEKALRVLGLQPAEALHVGDSRREDLCGAQRAGIEAILLVRNWRPAMRSPAAAVVSSLEELIPVVARRMQGAD